MGYKRKNGKEMVVINMNNKKNRPILDPIAIIEDGEHSLIDLLNGLSASDLKTIIRINKLDSAGVSKNWRNTDKLCQFILVKSEEFADPNFRKDTF
jgi:hypothetical protein